ncbi:MAG: hypothetical protein Q8N79_09690, partial [Candidatus Methanoperedens sp.]|nr:hypothetical protein [Candidatus Methanoperedens sp.]
PDLKGYRILEPYAVKAASTVLGREREWETALSYSTMKGNFHVRFLEEGERATVLLYSAIN